MGKKLLSIILATYNCGAKVENTLKSIFSQDKNLFELIVIDGTSTDETLKYINKYAQDLTLISESDKGIYDAYNKGIDLAKGKYLYFIGAGDCLRNDILKFLESFLQDERWSFVYGDAFLINKRCIQGGEYNNKKIMYHTMCHQAVFYHHDIFQLIGKYDLKYQILADWAFHIKCYSQKNIKRLYLADVIIVDFEGGGISDLIVDNEFYRDLPKLLKNHLNIRFYTLRKLLKDVYNYIYWKLYFPLIRPVLGPWVRYLLCTFKFSKTNINKFD